MKHSLQFYTVIVIFAVAIRTVASNSAEGPSSEEKSFTDIKRHFSEIREGGDNPTPSDLDLRRKGAAEMIEDSRRFLTNFPNSKRNEDVQGFITIALGKGALAGKPNYATELQLRARALATNDAIPDQLKQHACVVNYMTQWGLRNGKVEVNEVAPEGRVVWVDGLFAAIDVVKDEESVFKGILLQARSGFKMTAEQTQALAERIRDHPQASAWAKADAAKILSKTPPYEIGKPVEIAFTAMDGREVDVSKFKGKVVFVVFWATWCGPCVGEIPNLKAVYDEYHEKGLEFVGISLDEDKDDLERFLKKQRIEWPQYFDGQVWNNKISFPYGITAVPELWVIDKKGNLRIRNPNHDDHDGLAAIFLTLSAE